MTWSRIAMAKDDYDVIAYKILVYLYACMMNDTLKMEGHSTN